ncbi:hypothetical protein CC79DRAFT_1380259 [Sarocladium strictum]
MALSTPVHGCHRVRHASQVLFDTRMEVSKESGDDSAIDYWARDEDIGYYRRTRTEVWKVSLPYAGEIRLSKASNVQDITDNFQKHQISRRPQVPAIQRPQLKQFHIFPRLATELQLNIWDFAVGPWAPRTITAYKSPNYDYPLMAILTRELDRHLWIWLWTCSYTRHKVIRAYGDPATTNFMFNPELDLFRIVARSSWVARQYIEQIEIEMLRNLAYFKTFYKEPPWWYETSWNPDCIKDIALNRIYRESDGTATALYRLKDVDMDNKYDADMQYRWRTIIYTPDGEEEERVQMPRVLLLGRVPNMVRNVEAADEPSLHHVLQREHLTTPHKTRPDGIKELTAHYTIFHNPWSPDHNELRDVVGKGIEALRDEGFLNSLESLNVVVTTKYRLEFWDLDWAIRVPHVLTDWDGWDTLAEIVGPETDNLPGTLPHFDFPVVLERGLEGL